MILKGAQRSGAKALAIHLLRTDENDHVEVHSVEGFCTHDLTEALKEVQAIAKGTRCRQPLFSVSLSPPASAAVTIEMFEAAISKIAETTGLSGQPRVVVFHEKDGRRHCHVVFSRIDAETMTAKNLPHFKLKLRQISRSLYFEHGWKMPRGLMNSAARNPSNVTLAEWQSAKRREKNAIDEKLVIQECWAASENGEAFKQLLLERGYLLAQGNRKNHVVISHDGRVSAIARATGLRAKDVRAKLGDVANLPDLSAARDQLASGLRSTFGQMAQEVRTDLLKKREELDVLKREMVEKHRNERAKLDKAQAVRWESEAKERASRLQRGLSGLWQRITGRTKTIKAQSASEAYAALMRDRRQRQALVEAQLAERQSLETRRKALRLMAAGLVRDLRSDLERALSGLDRSKPRRVDLPEAGAFISQPAPEI